MESLLLPAELLLFLAVALGLGRPALRRPLGLLACLSALALLGWGFAAEGVRELEIRTSVVAYVGNDIRPKDFTIETVQAAAGCWQLLGALWAGAWGAILLVLRTRPVHPFWLPLLFGLSTVALTLLWEKAAAPEALVRPAGIERGLLLASALAAVQLALRCRKALLAMAWLSLFVTGSRLPVAITSSWLTQEGWGTSLDVHSITAFANPLLLMPVEVEQGSTQQAAYLIWGPQLLVMPALYMLSLGGLAFALVMYLRHEEQMGTAPAAPADGQRTR